MESRAKRPLAYAFGGLLVLMALTGAAGLAAFEWIRSAEAGRRAHYQSRAGELQRIRTGILLSGTVARDYFVQPEGPDAPVLIQELTRLEQTTHASLVRAGSQSLAGEVDAYWKVLRLMQEMARKRRNPGLDSYFQRQLTQRRETMLRIADDISRTLDSEWNAAEAQAASLYRRLRFLLLVTFAALAAAACIVARVTSSRLIRWERDARALSAELVRTGEQERRAVARELHDEIGQWLTGLRLHVGALRVGADITESQSRLEAMASEVERCVEAVRRIALTLRPSMLDDLGLAAALEWQAREIGNRTGLRVDVHASDELHELTDEQRTCIYRVGQEALANCARHARATRAEVTVQVNARTVSLLVKDDGAGFDPSKTRGLGILGMSERVAQLGGRFRIDSAPGRGAVVYAELAL